MNLLRFTTCVITAGIVTLAYSTAFTQAVPSTNSGYTIFAHAHNDYEHERPLLDALAQDFHSVEADIWLVDGEIRVSHDKGKYKGSLKDLYLDPLHKRVIENGTVHSDGEPFYLWIDIKDGRAELRSVLHKLLKRYAMMTVFSDWDGGQIVSGAVTVILTGDAGSKRAYMEEYPIRWACRDSNYYDPDDPVGDCKWQWYALNFKNYVKWNGNEPIADDQYEKLLSVVNDAHAKGRKIRFWSCPDNERFWTLALKTGIDHINTDKLEALGTFLKSYKK